MMGSILNNSLIVRRHRNGFVRRPVIVRGRTVVGTASPVDDRVPRIGVFEDRGRRTVLFAADDDRRIWIEGRDPVAAVVTAILQALLLRPTTFGISAVNGRHL